MGQWNITIRGTGCHHNKDLPTDANRMAAEFVEQLKDAGHTVASATITFGAEDDLTAEGYAARWEPAPPPATKPELPAEPEPEPEPDAEPAP